MVAATGDDHGEKGTSSKGHAVRLLHYSREAEHFRVHFQGGDGTRSDDNRTESIEDGFDGDCGIKAGEVEDRIWDGRGI